MATNENSEEKQRTPLKTIGQRKSFTVRIFEDEYESLELDPDATLFEGQVHVRSLVGVPIPMRKTASGSGVSGMARAIKDADKETRDEILALLQKSDKKTQTDVETEDEDENDDEESEEE